MARLRVGEIPESRFESYRPHFGLESEILCHGGDFYKSIERNSEKNA